MKKLTAIFMALALMFSMLAITALAEYDEEVCACEVLDEECVCDECVPCGADVLGEGEVSSECEDCGEVDCICIPWYGEVITQGSKFNNLPGSKNKITAQGGKTTPIGGGISIQDNDAQGWTVVAEATVEAGTTITLYVQNPHNGLPNGYTVVRIVVGSGGGSFNINDIDPLNLGTGIIAEIAPPETPGGELLEPVDCPEDCDCEECDCEECNCGDEFNPDPDTGCKCEKCDECGGCIEDECCDAEDCECDDCVCEEKEGGGDPTLPTQPTQPTQPTPTPVIPTPTPAPVPAPIVDDFDIIDDDVPLAELPEEIEEFILEEAEVPLAEFPPVEEVEEEIDLFDMDVPLDELPQTGIISVHGILFILGAVLSIIGMGISIVTKKPTKDAK